MTDHTFTTRSVADIEAELAAARQRDADLAKASRDLVTPEYTYEIAVHDSGFSHEKIWDPEVIRYRLVRIVHNGEALKEAGHNTQSYQENQGMQYLFNLATGHLIMADGGGNVFISPDGHWGDTPDPQVLHEMNDFLAKNPEGGDVTEIVESHRTRRTKKS